MRNLQLIHRARHNSTRNFFKQALLFIVGISVFVCSHAAPSFAQIKYDPDQEEIEKMARMAVAFLESDVSRLGGEELVLAALTVSEVIKRYEQRIPTESPVLSKALATIMASVNGDGGPANSAMETHGNVYYPALSLIVLCDVDDEKYRDEIIKLIQNLESRQQANGAYNYIHHSRKDPTVGDISQTQYACLAFFVARHHGYNVDNKILKSTLEWLMAEQSAEGSWYYHTRGGRPVAKQKNEKKLTLSRHCCGLGTTYLLSDLLQLSPRRKGGGKKRRGTGLPRDVSVYVKPKMENEAAGKKNDGPLVSINGGQLASTKRQGNKWFADQFSVTITDWNYYYLYGLERYAFFREQAEVEVDEVPDWYDQGVEWLMTMQEASGMFRRGSKYGLENVTRCTCLGTLFLVRSSQVLILPVNTSTLDGGLGFPEDTPLKESKPGKISSQAAVKNIEDVMNLLDEDTSDEQLRMLADSMDEAIRKFSSDETKSRTETLAFLTGLVKDRNYFKRLIAVKMLAREQAIDNVPALLYALGDPDLRICREAHDGLRLVSRKIDAFPLANNPTLTDFKMLKRSWTKWFLEIRPGADLID